MGHPPVVRVGSESTGSRGRFNSFLRVALAAVPSAVAAATVVAVVVVHSVNCEFDISYGPIKFGRTGPPVT